MDANGSRFHLLLGQADWSACRREDADGTLTLLADDWAEQSAAGLPRLGWDPRRQALMLPALAFRLRDAPRDGDLDPDDRRGAAADAWGTIYWLDEGGIRMRTAGGGAGRFWPLDETTAAGDCAGDCAGNFAAAAPAPAAVDLRGLAVLDSGHLVAGLVAPAGLLIFDLQTGGPPRRLLWPQPPAGVAGCRPVALAARPRGGLWLLDAGPGHCRVWALDGQLDFECLHRQPASGEPFADCPLTLPDARGVALTAAGDAAWVLDNTLKRGSCGLWKIAADASPLRLETRGLLDLLDADAQEDFHLRGHDLLALADGRLLLVADDGNQVFAFLPATRRGKPVLDALPEYRPLRRYTPLGLVPVKGEPHYASQGHWIPLVEQARPRHQTQFVVRTPADGPRPAFDGEQPGCVWHRLLIDACVPPGATLRVESRAAEQASALELTPWQAEPAPYRRSDGSELPWLPANAEADAGTWELLLQNARGRHLQLRLTLLGDGRSSLRLTALRVYFPRFSWVDHYLPAAWRRDPVSASFVERWLANPEGLFTTLEDRLAAVHCLFDPRSVPPEFLDWLAGWFGLTLSDGWSARRKRLLLRHADQMFRERGTRRGLLRALRLAVDPDDRLDDTLFAGDPGPGPWGIRLVEHFLRGADDWPEAWDADAFRRFLMRRYGDIRLLAAAWAIEAKPPADFAAAATALDSGEGSAAADRALFAEVIQPARRQAHRFSVLLPRQDCEPKLADRIAGVLAREAPAHTAYALAEYDLALRVGAARLGVDSVLGADPGWAPLVIDHGHLGLAWLAPPPAGAGRWPADRFPLSE